MSEDEVINCHAGKNKMDDSCEMCINGKVATCQIKNVEVPE